MNARISPIRRLVVPALLFLLYTPAALAMGDNSPGKKPRIARAVRPTTA